MCSSKEEAELETLLSEYILCKAGAPPWLEKLSASCWNKAGASPRPCRLGKLSAVPSGSLFCCWAWKFVVPKFSCPFASPKEESPTFCCCCCGCGSCRGGKLVEASVLVAQGAHIAYPGKFSAAVVHPSCWQDASSATMLSWKHKLHLFQAQLSLSHDGHGQAQAPARSSCEGSSC